MKKGYIIKSIVYGTYFTDSCLGWSSDGDDVYVFDTKKEAMNYIESSRDCSGIYEFILVYKK